MLKHSQYNTSILQYICTDIYHRFNVVREPVYETTDEPTYEVTSS